MVAFDELEAYVDAPWPQRILLRCGADSLRGDPITHLAYTEAAHASAASCLRCLADRHCEGRLLAMGGGGYHRRNLACADARRRGFDQSAEEVGWSRFGAGSA